MNNYKISVLIPTYNRGRCILNAINSVIKQSYKNWEIIIIDDGSIDDTENLIKPLLNNNIKYFYQNNQWKGNAVNFGMWKMEGDVMFILDSDDEFIDWAFEEAVKEFKLNPDLTSVHFKAKFPEWIKRKSQIIWGDRLYLTYINFLKKDKFVWDFHWFFNLSKFWIFTNQWFKSNIFFEPKCPNWLEIIFLLRLSKLWGKSLFINKEFLYMDCSRGIVKKSDNLTSFSNIYKRAETMIIGYEILINENMKQAKQIDINILWKRYLEKYLWWIISGRKSFNDLISSIKYTKSFQNKLKNSIYSILFFTPNILLKHFIKYYYFLKNK